MALKYSKIVIKYVHQQFPFQGSPKFTQFGIFGLTKNHLATPVAARRDVDIFLCKLPIDILKGEREPFFSFVFVFVFFGVAVIEIFST
jgi:hypothetical protein